jgi:Tfp pilus assembly protein PilO
MPTKDRERLLVGGAVIAALLMLLVGYFALIGPQRSKTRDINAQVADATTQNSVLSNKISTLTQQNRDLKKYEQDLATQEKALPSQNDLNAFLRTLEGLGTATGSDASFTAGSPVDVTAGSAVGSGTGTTTGTAVGTGTGADLTVHGKHIYALPITAQVTGTVASLSQFLDELQAQQPRALLITQVTETKASSTKGADNTGLSLTMQAFVAPGSTDGSGSSDTSGS